VPPQRKEIVMFEKVKTSMCTVKDIHEIIEQCHATENTPIFVGDSGIGKTYNILEYAAMRKMHSEVLNCSDLFVEDFGAIRDENGYVRFVLNEIFNVPKEGTALFFIDEFSRARGDLRNLIAGMVNERKVYGRPIPDNIRFAIAMNPPTEDYGDTDDPFVDMATARRYAIFNVVADAQQWLAWGRRNGVSEKTRAFIAQHPSYLIGGQACPRQWVKLDNLIKKYGENAATRYALGTVGSAGIEFIAFLTNKKIVTTEDIIENYAAVRKGVMESKELQLGLGLQLCNRKLKAKDKRNITMFFLDLNEEIKYKVILDLSESKLNSKLVMDWVDNNQSLREFMEEQSSY